jgi:hypothetical protein
VSKPHIWRVHAFTAQFAAAVPLALAVIVGVAVLPNWASQTSPSPKVSPSVSVLLPPDIPSETVQIAYYLIGPFGGSETYTDKQAGLHSYEIATSEPETVSLLSQSVENETGRKAQSGPATQIKIIVYAPGCEIQTFDLPLTIDSRVKEEFDCRPVAKVTLSGQIEPRELVRDKKAELVVTYMATWAYHFFGFSDGAETEFQLASVSPDANGMFQVDLPYFRIDAEQASSRARASFDLMLRDPETWNPIAFNLEPASLEYMTEEHTLRIQSHYPINLKFTATPPLQKQ